MLRPMRVALGQQPQGLRSGRDIGPAEHVIAKFCRGGTAHPGPVSRCHRPWPECGGHAVVVFLGNRIKLVVVAAGALERQPQEGGAGRVHQVFEPLVAILEVVVGLIVPGAHPQKPCGDHRLLIGVGHFVTSELTGHKPVEGHVAVERLHHPVAIPPGPWLLGIPLVAVGLGVAGDVEPVTGLPLTKMGRGEQTIHLPLVGIRRAVGPEGLELGRGGGQADQIKGEPPQERAAVGLRGGRKASCGQPRVDEAVDRIAGSAGRRERCGEWLQAPPVAAAAGCGGSLVEIEHAALGPDCPGVDPGGNCLNLCVRQPLSMAVLLRRHLTGNDPCEHKTGLGISGHHRRPAIAPSREASGRRQIQPPLSLTPGMTLHASPQKDIRCGLLKGRQCRACRDGFDGDRTCRQSDDCDEKNHCSTDRVTNRCTALA